MDEAFELIYTNLPGATGDEQWRAKAAGRTVKLVVHERGRESCLVPPAGSGDAESCQPDDLALAPFPEPDLWSAPLDAILGSLQSWNRSPSCRRSRRRCTATGRKRRTESWYKTV